MSVTRHQGYYDAEQLARRYRVKDCSRVAIWVKQGKFPPHDTTGFAGRYLWKRETVLNWEATHGGNPEGFRKFTAKRVFMSNYPAYDTQQINIVESEQDNNDLADSEDERHIGDIFNAEKKSFAEKYNAGIEEAANRSITAREFDNLIECVSVNSTKINALIKVVSILTSALKKSSGLLYGQLKAAGLPMTALEKELNNDEEDDLKPEGTDE